MLIILEVFIPGFYNLQGLYDCNHQAVDEAENHDEVNLIEPDVCIEELDTVPRTVRKRMLPGIGGLVNVPIKELTGSKHSLWTLGFKTHYIFG